MARAPRGTGVPKTTGQGISRSAYHNQRALTGGKAIGGGVRKAKVPKGETGQARDYGKGGMNKSDFNVEFGGMFDTDDVKALGDEAPESGFQDKRRENVGYKASGEKYKTSSAQRHGKKG